MDIRILQDVDAVAEAAAREVLRCVAARRDACIALPTGRTPVELYRRLAAWQRDGAADLRRVRWFALDEFLGVAPDGAASFRRWLEEHLVRPAGLDPARLDALRGDAADPDAEAAAYEARIRAAGGLDLALLGLGTNGHLAFNEPGTPADSRAGLRRLSTATRAANAYLFPGAVAPESGLSMGLATIRDARSLVLLATGASKAPAVAALRRPGTPVEACPAVLLRDHPAAVVLLDPEAAGGAPAAARGCG